MSRSRDRPSHTRKISSESSADVNGLYLSVHHSTAPFRNRFQALEVERRTANPVRSRAAYPGIDGRRRLRTSRGTKEGKRRRDARRRANKRAARVVDERLSAGVDALLNSVDDCPSWLSPPNQHCVAVREIRGCATPKNDDQIPATSRRDMQLIRWPGLPRPSPLQVPFHPKIAQQTNPAIPIQQKASHCPPQPSLNRQATRLLPVDHARFDSNETSRPIITSKEYALRPWLPPGLVSVSPFIYYDLSKLPETPIFGESSNARQITHFGHGRGLEEGKKHSRFFPLTPTAKEVPTSTACRLHEDDGGVTTTAIEPAHSRRASEPTEDYSQGTAANLWSILTQERCLPALPGDDCPSPVELDGREVPFVHPNALTGFCNDMSSMTYAENTIIPLSQSTVGLNEYLVDQDMIVSTDERDDRAAEPKTSVPISESLPVECAVEEAGARIRGEKELFTVAEIPLTVSWTCLANHILCMRSGCSPECWCNGARAVQEDNSTEGEWVWFSSEDEPTDEEEDSVPMTWKEFLNRDSLSPWTPDHMQEYDDSIALGSEWVWDL